MASRRTTARGRRPSRERGGAPGDDGETPLVVYGARPVLELLRSGEGVARLYVGPGAHEQAIRAAAEVRGIRPEAADRAALDRLARSPHHQGTVAVGPPFRYAELERVLAPTCPSALVLDGLQDPRNLGAMLRTARAAGVGAVVLPRDRSVGITPVVAAAAAGLLFGLSIVRVPNLVRALVALKEAGYWLLGLDPHAGRSLYDVACPGRPALVVGGEGAGLRSLVRRTCDFTVSIPMASGVDSLNAAVAAGVALYEVVVRARRGQT
jgi:23S rRNA (guanosine2251-2'-O)-methyltransferase